jgi:hypothetical protein
MKNVKYLFVIVALLALSSAAARAQTSVENSLAAAEKKWAMKKPVTYEFTVKFCFSCPSGVSDRTYDPTLRFRVENDDERILTPSSYTLLLDPFISVRFGTVESIFAAIRAELTKRPDKVEIEYDPDLGYPRRVLLDSQQQPTHRFDFAVQDFTPVPSR